MRQSLRGRTQLTGQQRGERTEWASSVSGWLRSVVQDEGSREDRCGLGWRARGGARLACVYAPPGSLGGRRVCLRSWLQTARELAIAMPDRWRIPPAARLLAAHGSVNAQRLESLPGEVTSPPAEAHILSYIRRGEPDHRLWFDDRPITEGHLPDRCLSLCPAGKVPRAVFRDRIQVTHVYLPHAYVFERAVQLGWSSGPGALELTNPDYRPDDALVRLCQCLSDALPGEGAADRLYIDSIIVALVSRLIQRWSNLAKGALPPFRGGLAAWQVKRACEAMDAELHRDVSLDELAELAGLSPAHFSRAFKCSTGIPPFTWLVRRRISRAKDLLADPNNSLAEIALEVGFAAQPQFTTAFRRETGLTPGAWRRTQL